MTRAAERRRKEAFSLLTACVAVQMTLDRRSSGLLFVVAVLKNHRLPTGHGIDESLFPEETDMATNVSGAPSSETYRKPFAGGWTLFAACFMIFGGTMAIFEGIGAIVNNTRYVVTGDYVYKFNVTGWGWLHLILGVLIVLAGCALFTGAVWARAVGVVIAGLNMIVNFLWLPYYPFWAIVLIAIDAFIIWALTAGTHRETVGV